MAASAIATSVQPGHLGGWRLNPYWLLLLPVVLILVLLYLVPLGQVLWLSFSDPELGLQNYRKLLTFPPQQRVLWTTLRICTTTTAAALLLGYLVAYVMLHVGERHRLWITAFVLVPFWISVLVRAFAWLTLLRTEGVVNSALLGTGLISTPLSLIYNEMAVDIGMIHYMVPYAVLPLYANMQGIDPRLVNASRSLGAGPFTSFRRIFLPMSMPGITSATLLVFILSLGFFVTPAILGGGKVIMIGEYVSIQILQTVRWGVGAMMATILLVAVLGLLAALSSVVNLKAVFGAK